MSNTITKEMTVGECYAIVEWYLTQLDKQKKGEDNILDSLPKLLLWKLRRNIKTIETTALEFETFKEETRDKLKEKWFTSDKSYEVAVPLKDENGKDLTDSDGSVITRPMKQVKKEYIDEFNKELEDVNSEIKSILRDKSEYRINVMDVESVIESIINQVEKTDFDDLEILLFMHEE